MMRLISPVVPTLLPTDTADKALAIMEDNRLSDLPVVQEDNYIGTVREREIEDWTDHDKELSSADLSIFRPAILSSAHPLEAVRLFAHYEVDVLPLIDFDQKYLGAITKDSLLKYIAETSSLDTPGAIIVLEIKPHNYSLYQIARLFENEDVSILSSQIHTLADGTMELTIKTNRTATDAVTSSLERHEYKVKEVFGDQKNMEDVMDKYALLMNYLNM